MFKVSANFRDAYRNGTIYRYFIHFGVMVSVFLFSIQLFSNGNVSWCLAVKFKLNWYLLFSEYKTEPMPKYIDY